MLFGPFLLILLFMCSPVLSQTQQGQTSINEQLRKDYACDQFIEILYLKENSNIFQQKIYGIQPYRQARILCFLVNLSKSNYNSHHLFNNNNFEAQNEKNYYLRVDVMPNQCINVTNDVRFQSRYLKQNGTQTKFLVGVVHLNKQCAPIDKKSAQENQINGHSNAQNVPKQVQPVTLILEIRRVNRIIFGFPIYQKTFEQLFFILIILWSIYGSYRLIMNCRQKQKHE